MFGAAAMSLSSFCVVSNALRLNLKNIRDARHDHKVKVKKEKKKMEKVMRIEGMMCPHCQARVKKTLEALLQVTEAEVNWQEGTAIVKLSQKVDSAVLKKAVEDQDYQVISVE
jgi:Cu2+-exporting ATPase